MRALNAVYIRSTFASNAVRLLIHKRPDGIVIIDPVKARGRQDLGGGMELLQILFTEVLPPIKQAV
jgi:hypothetical protein